MHLRACAILFSGQGVKFKRVPRRVRSLPAFNLSDAEWNGLMVPINMAFFLDSLENRVVALYPSPAGATESLLALESWNDIVARNPILNEMESDVEGLLVNRLGYSRGYSAAEYYLLPIDECYKLVGLIRMHWKGLSGGTEVWRQLGEFFTSLKENRSKSNPMPDLSFQVEGAEVVANAATPLLAFKLRLTDANPEQTIHTVALRCQIQLEVTRRKYTAEDQARLLDLFGEPSRWGQTLRNLLWTHANLVVPSFKGSALVDLPVPCTFDFNVAATKYFEGLRTGTFRFACSSAVRFSMRATTCFASATYPPTSRPRTSMETRSFR